MKEQIMQYIEPLIKEGSQGVLKAVDVLQEQAPLLVQEILRYHLVLYSVGLFFGCITLFYAIHFGRLSARWHRSDDDEDGEKCFWSGVVSFVSLVASSVFLSVCIPKFIQILLAPRLFLLEYLKKFFV